MKWYPLPIIPSDVERVSIDPAQEDGYWNGTRWVTYQEEAQ